MVTPHNTLGDIGCDHGYMSITLVDRGVVKNAIAADVNQGPLDRAATNISKFGLEDRIKLRLSDGLKKFSPGEVDVILIAGMGGPLMTRILREGADVVAGADELVLQPQSNLEEFRRNLYSDGYKIVAEDIVFEDGKYYPMMRAVKGCDILSDIEYKYGPILISQKSHTFVKYMENEQKKLQLVLDKLKESSADSRRKEVFEELEIIGDILKNK